MKQLVAVLQREGTELARLQRARGVGCVGCIDCVGCVDGVVRRDEEFLQRLPRLALRSGAPEVVTTQLANGVVPGLGTKRRGQILPRIEVTHDDLFVVDGGLWTARAPTGYGLSEGRQGSVETLGVVQHLDAETHKEVLLRKRRGGGRTRRCDVILVPLGNKLI